MELGLSGRKALVAGASRGIGFAIAKLLREEGASIAVCGREAGSLEDARIALEAAGAGGTVFARATDLSDGDDTRAFVRESIDALGGLDIYIHSATGGSDTSDEGWVRSLMTDLMAPVRGIEVAIPALEASGVGSILLIGSTTSVQWFPRPGSSASGYGPSKAAQRVFVNELGQTLGRRKIRANALSPGSTYFEGGNWDNLRATNPEVYEGLVRQFPFRRLVAVDEVARAAVFVASPAGSGINATHTIVDGGQNKSVQ